MKNLPRSQRKDCPRCKGAGEVPCDDTDTGPEPGVMCCPDCEGTGEDFSEQEAQ